jgi:hypothetical protein
MGWLGNMALKTAVKKSLLDITEQTEKYQKKYPGMDFQKALMCIAKDQGIFEKETFRRCESWEGQFLFVVIKSTRDQIRHDPNFWKQENLQTITKLVGEWVLSLGGSIEKMVADTNK